MQKLIVIVMLFCTFYSVAQNDEWDDVEIKTIALTDNIVMLMGRGGNIGAVKSDEAVLVIDAQFEPLYDKIKNSISEWSKLPVTYLLNTHWHGDHTGGNNKFYEDGAILISHKNVQVRLSSEQKIDFFGKEVPASPTEAIPTITFNDKMSISIGEETVNLIHLKNAHTDGDAIVHFPKSNVIHMGDVYFAGMYPFIDLSSGGNISGVIEACEFALSISDQNTQIIPGHGPLSSREELKEYTAMLKDLLINIAESKKNGLGLKEVIEKDFTSKHNDNYENGFIISKDIVAFVYNSL